MLTRSFRVAPARLIPRAHRGKTALLLAALILAGCGGSAQEKAQVVRGNGFRFEAPAGWHVVTTRTTATASHDGQISEVSVFPLVKPYSDALFERVTRELDATMQKVAKQLGGTVSGPRTVTSGGIRSHSYDVAAGKSVVEYTFVLRGMREYELLCRRQASGGDAVCKQLLTSFAPA
jgi:hypothetical protein